MAKLHSLCTIRLTAEQRLKQLCFEKVKQPQKAKEGKSLMGRLGSEQKEKFQNWVKMLQLAVN